MNVRMVEHGARPGMQDGQSADTGAEESWIASQLLEGRRGGLHQQAVDEFGMRPSQGTQLGWQREGDQVIRAREQSLTLLADPAFGLIAVTLRATAVAAGVIRIDLLRAVVALVDMASKERRAAVSNIAKGLFLNRCQLGSELRAIRIAVEADNVSHLQHRTGLQVLHELIQWAGYRIPHLTCQMGVDLC